MLLVWAVKLKNQGHGTTFFSQEERGGASAVIFVLCTFVRMRGALQEAARRHSSKAAYQRPHSDSRRKK